MSTFVCVFISYVVTVGVILNIDYVVKVVEYFYGIHDFLKKYIIILSANGIIKGVLKGGN